MDQTDIRDNLMDVDERLLMAYDTRFSMAASALDCHDVLTGADVAFVRLAPVPSSRPEQVEDFILEGARRRAVLLANGYPLVELIYRGGDAGRQRAVIAFQWATPSGRTRLLRRWFFCYALRHEQNHEVGMLDFSRDVWPNWPVGGLAPLGGATAAGRAVAARGRKGAARTRRGRANRWRPEP